MHQDDSLRENPLSAQRIYTGAIIDVEKWRVSLPDGRQADREVVLHKGAAAVVAVDERGNVTLVRQHRVVSDCFTWEIPAGKLDCAGEDPLLCAQRELREETGLVARHWQLLNRVITTPGFCNERISLYLATGLSQHVSQPDADEFLRLMKMPLDDAVRRVMSGEFEDLKTCCALLMAQRVLEETLRRPLFDGLPPNRRTAKYPAAEA